MCFFTKSFFFSLWSSEYILKLAFGLPSSNFKQNECIVEICILLMSLTLMSSSINNLFLSSSAALMVKVITTNDAGSASFFKRCFILSIKTNVFPAPGPASIKRGLFLLYSMHIVCLGVGFTFFSSLIFKSVLI